MSDRVSGHERRRANRMSAAFRLRIAGVDRHMVERRGDISRTGLYVEVDEPVGRPGSVQALLVAIPESEDVVHALARVVRVAAVDDLYEGHRVIGVAFEFLLADSDEPVTGSYDKVRAERTIKRLVRTVAARHLVRETLELGAPIEAEVQGAPNDGEAVVSDLGKSGVTLVTSWPIPRGESVRLEVPGPPGSERMRVVGKASRVTRDGAKYRVDIDVTGVEDLEPKVQREQHGWSAAGESMSEVVGLLLDQALAPRYVVTPRGGEDLFGDLARIPIPSLLTLLETDRLDGVLKIHHPDGPLMVYVQNGAIIAAEGHGRSPRGALATVLGLREGEFEFRVEPIDHDDVFGMPLTALVLDVIRELDEVGRS